MTSRFLASFLHDVRKLRDAKVRLAVARAIENVDRAAVIEHVKGIKRLSGQAGYYRIRIGEWRIGLYVSGETVTFVRCLHRREVYRYFP